MGALRSLSTAFLLLVGLPAPGTAADQTPPLRLALPASPATLDPHRMSAVADMRIAYDLCEGLVTSDALGRPVPGLAHSWTLSADGLTYRFNLREDARWSDGRPVVADDFVYSWRRAVDPGTQPGSVEVMFPIKGAQAIAAGKASPDSLGIAAPDERTVVVQLARANPDFLSWTALSTQAMPVDRQAVVMHGDGFTRPGAFTCTGAYRLVAMTPQDRAVLEVNPHHYGTAPDFRRVEYLFVEDEEMQLKQYRAGELDVTYSLPSGQIDWVRKNLPAELRFNPIGGTTLLEFNLRNEPWASRPDLRRALSLAINREVLVSRVLRGGEQPAYGLIPPDFLAATDIPPLTVIPRDGEEAAEEARRIIAKAGPLPRLDVLYNSSQVNRRTLIAVAAMWKQVLGVETQLTNIETKSLLSQRLTHAYPHMLRISWIETLPIGFLQRLLPSTEEGGFDLGYRNSAFVALLDSADRAADQTRRVASLRAAERMALSDMPVIPLYHPVIARLVTPRVDGWQENPADIHPTRLLRAR